MSRFKNQKMTLGSNKLTLGYWPFRGISQSIRYILHFTKTEFNDKMYSDRDEWFKGDKLTIDCPFPNLPYYVDGNVKLVQSMAILKYIGELIFLI